MKTKTSNRFLLALTFISAAFTAPGHAAPLYKVNNSDNLNLTSSWTDTSGLLNPPLSIGSGDALYFNQINMQGDKAVLLGGDLAVGGLALDWAGTTDPGAVNYSSLVINSGNTLTLNATSLGGSGVAGANYTGAGIVLNRGTGGTVSIHSNVALGAAQQWVTGRSSGTPLTVTGDINLGANNLRLLMVGGGSTNTLSGVISGTGKVTKENSGVLNISGNNTFSGGFQLGADAGGANSGVVNVGHANALGTGTVIIRGTQLRSSVADLVIPNNFNMGAGGFRLGGTNNFSISGTLAMDAASRTIANYGTATVTLGNISTVTGSTVAFDNAAGAATGAPIIVNGVISGPGAVALSGNQFTTFNGTNTYAGTTTMSGGRIAGTGTIPTLLAMSGGSIAIPGGATTNSALTLAAGATFTNTPTVTFDAAPVAATVYDVFNYTGTLTDLANLKPSLRGTFTDTGTKVTFTAGAQNQARTWNTTTGTWDGTGTNANWLEDDNRFYNGDSAIFPEPAEASTVTLTGTLNITGFSVTNTSNAYTFTGGAITGTTGLTKTGAGAMTIGNGHTFTGNVLISGGTVTATGGVPSGNTNSSFGLKSGSRTVTAENPGTTVWLTATTGSSNTFGGGGMTVSQIPTLIARDGAAIRTGKFNTVGNVILQNGGALTSSTTENSGSYGGYQFIGPVTVSGTGSGTSIDLNGSTRPNHLLGGSTITFDVTDITASSAADLTVSAPLADGSGDYAGIGSLAKSGSGTMLLTAANPYTGTTTVNGGTLEVSGSTNSSSASIATGATLKVSGTGTLNGAGTITNNGTLAFTGSASQTLSGAISGTGQLNKSGTGTLTLAAGNTYSGATTVNGGTLVIDGAGQLDAASAVTVGGTGTLRGQGIANGDVTVTTGGTLTGGNGTSGTLSLGSLTFDSTATVNIGTLENYTSFAAIESYGDLAATGGTGSVTVNLPTAPIVAGTYRLISSANTLSNTAAFALGTKPALGSRQSGVLVANPGSLDYEVSGINPVWTGAASGEWSTATLASPKNWFTNVETDYLDGDAVTFDDTATGTTAVTLDSTLTPASVSFIHDTLTYSVTGTGTIAGTGSLTKSGFGTLTLGTANSYSGGTTVNSGTLILGHASALGTGAVALNAATLNLGAHTLANAIASSGGTLAGTAFQMDGAISGTSLDINATGIVKFNAVNTYTGATNIVSGGLDLIGASQLNSGDYSGTITNPALLRFNTSADQILRGSISGNGQLVKNQSNTLDLRAQNTYIGGTTVNGGTLKLSGGGGEAGTIRGTATLSGSGTSLWLNTSDATGYNGNATSLTTINLGEGTNLHNNMDARIAGGNQTLGNAVINMTGASITGVTGSNLDFFAGASALNTFASATTSTISGTALDLRQASGVTFTVENGPANVDLEISSMLTNRPPTATGPGTGTTYGNNPLIKTGDGVMKLTGASNYTGHTTLNGGVLDLTSGQIYTGGYQSFAVVTVNTGATLKITNIAYNETAGSAASLGGLRDYGAARVINGGTFEVLGGAHSAGNNFNVGANGGTFRFDPPVDTDTLTLTGNGNSNIAVNGPLTLDTVGNLTINEVIEGTGTLAKTGAGTLTLGGANTRSGATTVSNGTLAVNGSSLADAASLTLDGGTVNLTGTETVDSLYFGATLQYAGTWGATGSGAQYIDDTRFSGSGTLNVVNGATPPASGYDTWAATNAPGQTADQDYDGDGVSNGVEYLLGGSAGANDSGKLPTAGTSGGNLVFTFVRDQDSKTADTSVKIDVGTTLASWPASYTVGNDTASSSAGVTVTDNGNGTDTITLTLAQAPDARKFARLVVTID